MPADYSERGKSLIPVLDAMYEKVTNSTQQIPLQKVWQCSRIKTKRVLPVNGCPRKLLVIKNNR